MSQSEQVQLVSYHEFLEQLADVNTAKSFLVRLLDEHYPLGKNIKSREDIEEMSSRVATSLGREHFPLFYLIQSDPGNKFRN